MDPTAALHLATSTKIVATIAALVFSGIGVHLLLAPGGGASFFGMPMSNPEGHAFVRTTGARNIGLSLTALALIALDARLGLAAMLVAASIIAGLDAAIVSRQSSASKSAKHWVYLVGLSGAGFWVGLVG